MTEQEKYAAGIVDRLNALIQDEDCRRAIGVLCNTRVTVCDPKRGMRDHPSLQVGEPGRHFAELGVLGLINGIIGVKPNGWGYVAASFALGDEPDHEPGALIAFKLLSEDLDE